MLIFLKLLIAHFIADFWLQPLSWIKAKEEKKFAAYQLYLHAASHGLLMMLFVWDLSFWKYALLLSVIHLLIDLAKVCLQSEKSKIFYFFLDQVLHFISILWVCSLAGAISFNFENSFNSKALLFLLFTVFLVNPVSIATQIVISQWAPQIEQQNNESLQNAGKYIGILERLLTFIFIISNHWEAVGFLLAAKSIFRFGDLKEAKDRKLTEYILIGTLLSFGCAILAGLIYVNVN